MRRALLLAALLLTPLAAQAQPQVIERLELKGATVADAAQLVAELTDQNIVVTPAAADVPVNLLLRNVNPQTAIETVCKVSGLWYRADGGITRIMTTEEYQADLSIQRDPEVKVFTLLHPNPESVGVAIRDLYLGRVRLSLGVDDRFSGSRFGAGGGGAGGVSNLGGAAAGFNGTAAGRFGNRVGGNTQNTLLGGGVFAGAQGGGASTLQTQPENELTEETLSAERLSRIEERDGQVTSDPTGLTRGLPPINVTVNRRHNLVVVRTSDRAALEQIEKLVIELDRPTPQVLLEMKILEVRLGDDFQSVFDVDYVAGPTRGNLETGKPVNPFLAGATSVAEQVAGAGNFPLTAGTLVYQFLNDHVRVRLQLLDLNNRVSVLSTPLLLCANDEVARIFVGEERPLVRNFELQTTSTNGVIQNTVVPTVDLRDIGNTLRIVPSINADRTVTLTILQDISTLVPGGATLPVPNGAGGVSNFSVDTVNTSNLEGTVIAKDGLTLAVGGLIRKSMVDRQEGIPYLMDLPLIGWLFGETVRAEEHTELILLVTPHVLMTPDEGRARSEARMKALSLHPFHDLGDTALNRYERNDVPGSAEYRKLVEDYLFGAPEPFRGED